MSLWFRFYASSVHDPKVQRLSGNLYKAWANILCLACENNGSIPPLDDIAFALRLDRQKAVTIIDELKSFGLIDDLEGRLVPHNWNGRQFKSDQSDQRVRKLRNGGVTPPEAEPKSETENKIGSKKRTYPDDFEEFWRAYPTDPNMSKKAAFDVWKNIAPDHKISATACLPGLKAYIETNKSWYRTVHAVKFLRDARWEGYSDSVISPERVEEARRLKQEREDRQRAQQ